MTKNEFIFCSNLLYLNYKGKKLKDIFGNYNFVNATIENPIFRKNLYHTNFINSFEERTILYHDDDMLCVDGFFKIREFEYKTVEEFLKAIKIPLEDIV